MIPPDANAAFVATMEDVLEVYQRPHDPQRPLVCLDETSKQLIIETRAPIPAKPGQPARHDCEYERNGVANLFMVFAHMDAFGNDWNTAPACVLSTVWGTASIRDLAVEVGAVPASPIRRIFTARHTASAAAIRRPAREPVDLWTTQECCPQTHRPNSNRRQSE